MGTAEGPISSSSSLSPPWSWLLPALAAVAAIWAVAVITLLISGRRAEARALAGFIPDSVIFLRRLLGDPAVPRRRKFILVLLLGYLASPIDLVPDFLPVIGQLDDALALVLVLRYVLRGGGPELLERHWPGPEASRSLVAWAAFGG